MPTRFLTCWKNFLPRDAMRRRGTSWRPLSVCLSVRHARVLYPNG